MFSLQGIAYTAGKHDGYVIKRRGVNIGQRRGINTKKS